MPTTNPLKESTKRFLVFASDSYYPGGGWKDFISSHDTLEEAEKARIAAHDWSWRISHIVDTTLGEIVIEQYEGNARSVYANNKS